MKTVIAGLICCVSVAAAYGDLEFTPWRGVTDKNVTGIETQSNVIAVQPNGAVNKTGEGNWVIPLNAIQQNNSFDVNVTAGKVQLISSAEVADYTGTEEALNKAALWLASDDATKMKTVDADGTTEVTRWCDTRETNVDTPTCLYAEPTVEGTNPKLKQSSYTPKTSVYFGGYKKWGGGISMIFRTPEGERKDFTNIRHVFFVVAVSSSGLGHVIGPDEAIKTNEKTGICSSDSGAYFSGYSNDRSASLIAGSRTYRNGVWIDPFDEPLSKTLQLLEVKMLASGDTGNLYASYLFRNQAAEYKVTGGDYLNEILIFTNDLTEVEGYKISQYLMEKWDLKTEPEKNFNIASNADVAWTLQAQESSIFENNINLLGLGSFVKNGLGELIFTRNSELGNSVSAYLDEGSLLAHKPFGLVAEGGSVLSAEQKSFGTRITRSFDGDKLSAVSQNGDGNVYVHEISEEVATYNVGENSTLILKARKADDGEPVTIEIPNGSFEEGESIAGSSKEFVPSEWTVYNVTNLILDGKSTPPNILAHQIGKTYGWSQKSVATTLIDTWDGNRMLIMATLGCTNGHIQSDAFVPNARGYFRLSAHGKCYKGWVANNLMAHDENAPKIRASVIVNGDEENAICLGTNTIANIYARKFVWQNVFELAGDESIAVKLENVNANATVAILDNLRFEKLSICEESDLVGELITNGNFDSIVNYNKDLDAAEVLASDPPNKNYESKGTWDERIPKGWIRKNNLDNDNAQYTASVIDISTWEKDWTLEADTGKCLVRITGKGSVEQSVNFPEAGVYELSFMANTPLHNTGWISAYNPLCVWLVDGSDVTNRIYWTSVTSSNLVNHTTLFRVPAAGVYKFGIQGLGNGLSNPAACVDTVSVKKFASAEEAIKLPSELTLNLAETSRVILDFPTTQRIARVTIGGTSYTGIVDANRFPDNFEGIGAFDVRPRGTVIIIR